MTASLSPLSPLWGARLLLVERATENAQACADWYAQLLDDPLSEVAAGAWQVRGTDRWMFFRQGPLKTVPTVVYALATAGQWRDYRTHLQALGQTLRAPDATLQTLLGTEAFAINDPDGRAVVFCVKPAAAAHSHVTLAARMQHFVCASTQTLQMLEFYRDVLGFIESDRVLDTDGDLSSAFVRSDGEHHSFAVFRAPQSGADHHAYEVPHWNAIRDWADQCGDLEIPLWWGPGRHGVGNNLFFMIEDPDGYKVEFSAELEHMTADQAFREWPHGPRALNLWGNAWMRS